MALLSALIGVVLGAALGFGAGLGLGLTIAYLAQVSCFEGYCGYFAVMFALLGAAIVGMAGAIFGVRLARRKPAS